MSQYSGHKNLEVLSQNHRFNEWIYEQIRPGLRGDVLEIGSGIGTFSEKIVCDLSNNSRLVLTDVSMDYVRLLEEKYSMNSICNSSTDHHNGDISVQKLDLNRKTDYEKLGYEKFDSIVAINVLEHVENDEFALHELYRMLRKNGMLIILVPCYKFLYNVIDLDIGHCRRYTKNDLESKVKKTQFGIQRMFYFNMLGIVGWYINGNLGKNPKINGNASKIFDRLVPLCKHLEKITRQKIGLSIVCYLLKN